MKILLRNACVFDTRNRFEGDVLIENGIVTSIAENISSDGAVVYNLDGKYIFPGFVDAHVHLREPGFSYKETIETGTMAAAAGGYTDICAMPNLKPVPDSREHLEEELDRIRSGAHVNVYPFGSMTAGEEGMTVSELEEMAGDVIGFSDDGKGLAADEVALEVFTRAAKLNKIISAHCEDMSVIGGSCYHDGRLASILGRQGISSESEWRMVQRDIELARKTGCRYHVCHVSTKESVELIRQAKREGIDITCETAPHYLVLDENDLAGELCKLMDGSGCTPQEAAKHLGHFKMNPPLRGAEDREALIEGVLDGTVDMIATDHAPHSKEEKERGLLEGPMGVVGLECAFPVLFTKLVKSGIITLEKLVDMMTHAPADRFGIKCGIRVGDEAKLCVYDLDRRYDIEPHKFLSMGKYTPFKGMTVFGRCELTVIGERIVYSY